MINTNINNLINIVNGGTSVAFYTKLSQKQNDIGLIKFYSKVVLVITSVLLIVIFYALPFVGIRLSPFTAAATALIIVSSAYTAEIFRSGIEAIPKGQFEASQALGLSFTHMMKDVILPQATRIVIPPLTNNSINVIKDTALASVVAMPDLLKQATQAQAIAANPTPLIAAAGIYLLVLLPMVLAVSHLEKRYSKRNQ